MWCRDDLNIVIKDMLLCSPYNQILIKDFLLFLQYNHISNLLNDRKSGMVEHYYGPCLSATGPGKSSVSVCVLYYIGVVKTLPDRQTE